MHGPRNGSPVQSGEPVCVHAVHVDARSAASAAPEQAADRTQISCLDGVAQEHDTERVRQRRGLLQLLQGQERCRCGRPSEASGSGTAAQREGATNRRAPRGRNSRRLRGLARSSSRQCCSGASVNTRCANSICGCSHSVVALRKRINEEAHDGPVPFFNRGG